jgi:hypothetical protein
MSSDGPRSDVIAEAERINETAAGQNIPIKLVGGAAVHLHSQSAKQAPLRRKYGDLDFVISSRNRPAVQKMFEVLGYEANERFNLLQGDQRLLFYDNPNGRQVDIFIDRMKMCHVIDLRDRLGVNGPSLAPADLLLSKMQIYEINQKDLVDLAALILDHPVADNDDEAINARYIARLTSEDWGLYRTLQLNTERLLAMLHDLDVQREVIQHRLDELWAEIERHPKSMKWKMRSRVGDRMSWYELPEEVRKPYEPA